MYVCMSEWSILGSWAQMPYWSASRKFWAALAQASNDFDGMQPVLRHSPPIFPLSIRATSRPSCTAPAAMERPAAPAPMMHKSIL